MRSWKARLLALLTAVAMLATVSGPAMAQSWDDWDDCIVWDDELYCPWDEDWNDEDDEGFDGFSSLGDWDHEDDDGFDGFHGFDGFSSLGFGDFDDGVDVDVNVSV